MPGPHFEIDPALDDSFESIEVNRSGCFELLSSSGLSDEAIDTIHVELTTIKPLKKTEALFTALGARGIVLGNYESSTHRIRLFMLSIRAARSCIAQMEGLSLYQYTLSHEFGHAAHDMTEGLRRESKIFNGALQSVYGVGPVTGIASALDVNAGPVASIGIGLGIAVPSAIAAIAAGGYVLSRRDKKGLSALAYNEAMAESYVLTNHLSQPLITVVERCEA